VSAIPPLGPGRIAPVRNRARPHVAIHYDRRVLSFFVGLVVGASLVALLAILVAPSRRVRAEPPLPRDVETSLLLGEDPDQSAAPTEAETDEPPTYSPNDLAELRRLSTESRGNRGKRKR
jgi:hypothetical protein